MTPDSGLETEERFLRVARTARYHVTGGGGRLEEVWIVCHGYGQLSGRFVRHFWSIAAPHRLIAAPEALNRYYLDDPGGPHGPESRVGATWMTREDRLHEIDDYVAYLDAVHRAVVPEGDGVRVTALGFSQGAATVSRWAHRTSLRVDRIVLWAGFLPPELTPSATLFGGAPLIVVLGDADDYASDDVVARQSARLDASGATWRLVRFRGGHKIDAAALARLVRDSGD